MGETIEVVGKVHSVETIASGPSLRVGDLLVDQYGPGNWRKRKGVAKVRLPDGFVAQAEIHWYEAHGVGRVDMKIKRFLD